MGLFLFSGHVEAACRNPNIAEDDPFAVPAAASGFIEIKWFGHSFFQITSSNGTKIITDPFGAMGWPMPEVWPHVVTIAENTGITITPDWRREIRWFYVASRMGKRLEPDQHHVPRCADLQRPCPSAGIPRL